MVANCVQLQEAERLKARAARFGIPEKAAPGLESKKRPSPAAEVVDEEELERRKKRAARFGLAPLVSFSCVSLCWLFN